MKRLWKVKINYNFLGVFVIVSAILNVTMSYHDCFYAKTSAVVYSIGLVIIYFIVVNCDMQWKKKE